jgi:hypothetical protein
MPGAVLAMAVSGKSARRVILRSLCAGEDDGGFTGCGDIDRFQP